MSVVLSEHLPLLATAPDGIQKLRGLILELAVRGKLVPQDQNDEPASELLKRIAMERPRLEAEGKIKKSKPIQDVHVDERPFPIPSNWQFVRLGSVLEMINGRAFKPTDWLTNGLPIIRIQNLNNELASFNYCDPETISERHLVRDDDLLISWSGTPGTSFGAFIWRRGSAALNQHIFRCVQIGDAFWTEFLRLAINSQLGVLISKAQGGVGLQHVTKGTLEALPLTLPPIAEQHRIVAKVDELMALCDQLEAEQSDAEAAHERLVATLLGTLTQSTDAADLAANWQRLAEHFDTLFTTESSLDALKQTILHLAYSGWLTESDASKWLKARLSEITDAVADIDHKMPKAVPDGVIFLSAKDLKDNGTLDFSQPKYISREDFERLSRRILPKRGDIIYSRIGARLGKARLVEVDTEFLVSYSCCVVRPNSEKVNTQYLVKFLDSRLALDQAHLGKQSIGVPDLGLGVIKSFEVPLPPLPEQHRIVAKVNELMALCDRLKAGLAESRAQQERLAATLIESALKAA